LARFPEQGLQARRQVPTGGSLPVIVLDKPDPHSDAEFVLIAPVELAV
jgi:hypothetical protein